MRNLLLLALGISFLSLSAQARELIPVCDTVQTVQPEELFIFDQAIQEVDKKMNEGKYCESATLLKAAMISDQKRFFEDALELSLLINLRRGGFTNDLVNELFEIKKLNPDLSSMAELDYQHVMALQELATDAAANPKGFFTDSSGVALSRRDETLLVQRHFLDKHPDHSKASSVRNELAETVNTRFEAEFTLLEKALKKNKKKAQSLVFIERGLARLIKESPEATEIPEALYQIGLANVYLSKYGKGDVDRITRVNEIVSILGSDSKLGEKLSKKIDALKLTAKNAELEELLDTIITESDEKIDSETLEQIIARKKGRDKTMFIPIEFSRHEKAVMLAGLGVAGILFAFDRPIQNFVQDNQDNETFNHIVETTNLFGEETALGPLILGSAAIGLVFKKDKFKQAAVRSIGAALLGQAVVEVSKALSHRQRPRSSDSPYDFEGPDWTSDNTSFPSGHSAGAWSVLTVFATEFSDTKIVPILAYGIAAMTSYARVHKNAHWASDVVLGAVVGYASGKLVSKLFRKKEEGKDQRVRVSASFSGISGGSISILGKEQAKLKSWPVDYYAFLDLNTKFCSNGCSSLKAVLR